MNITTLNLDLAEKALNGDKFAARLYCGSYDLYRSDTDKLYRVKGDAPSTWSQVTHVRIGGRTVSVNDKDGFLISDYWSLPRCIDGVLS